MDQGLHSVQQPIDLVRLSLNSTVKVKERYGRELVGTLIAYDTHLNLLMTNATQKIIKKSIDQLTKQQSLKIKERQHSAIFVRGDLVIFVSPQVKVVS